MQKCQEAYDTQPKLYKVSCAIVAKNKDDDLVHERQTFIVEAVDAEYGHYREHDSDGTFCRRIEAGKMPYHGLMPENWLVKSMPFIIENDDIRGKEEIIVISSIV
eukprot:7386663-Prymnesium_polylepis.1